MEIIFKNLSPIFWLNIIVVIGFISCALPQKEHLGKSSVSVQTQWHHDGVGFRLAAPLEVSFAIPKGLEQQEELVGFEFASQEISPSESLVIGFGKDKLSPVVWVDCNFNRAFEIDELSPMKFQGHAWSSVQELRIPVASQGRIQPLSIEIWMDPIDTSYEMEFLSKRIGMALLDGKPHSFAVIQTGGPLFTDEVARPTWVLFDTAGEGPASGLRDSEVLIAMGESVWLNGTEWLVRLQASLPNSFEFIRLEDGAIPEAVNIAHAGIGRGDKPHSLHGWKRRFNSTPTEQETARIECLRAIGSEGSSAALQFLSTTPLREASKFIHAATIEEIAKQSFHPKNLKILERLAKDSKPSIANPALTALYGLEGPNVEALIMKRCKETNNSITGIALTLLLEIGSESAFKATLDKFHNRGDLRTVRFWAYQSLRGFSFPIPEKTMIKAARDDFQFTRALGLRDLKEAGHPKLLEIANQVKVKGEMMPELCAVLMDIFATSSDPEAIRSLIELDLSIHPKLEKQMRQLLEGVASFGRTPLLDGLRSKNSELRRRCVLGLSNLVDGDVAKAFIRQIPKERNSDTQRIMIQALGSFPTEDSIKALVSLAKKRRLETRDVVISTLLKVAPANPDVIKLMEKYLKDRSAELRIWAMDAVAESKAVDFGNLVADQLEDSEWPTRFTAAETLRELQDLRWVEALIGQVQVEKKTRVLKEIGKALHAITGENPNRSPKMWSKWWSDNRETFTRPTSIQGFAPQHSSRKTVGSFYGLTVNSDRAVFVLDQSASMMALIKDPGTSGDPKSLLEASRFGEAIANTKKAVEALPDNAKVNLVFFGDFAVQWKSELNKLSKSNRRKMNDFLEKQTPVGGTNLFEGIEMAMSMKEVDKIMLLSDGNPSTGVFVLSEDVLREVGRLNRTRKIAIDCVAVGMKSPLLKNLATKNYGRYAEVGMSRFRKTASIKLQFR